MATQATEHPQPRNGTRQRMDVPVRVIVHSSEKTLAIEGHGKTINESGMAVFAGVELPPEANVEVEFTPPLPSHPVRVKCGVCNRNGYYYGLRFLADSGDEHRQVMLLRLSLSNVLAAGFYSQG